MNDAEWWQLQVASPAERYWRDHVVPAKGEFGGQCHHPTCNHAAAEWYNRSSGKYYCDSCAGLVNRMCGEQGMLPLCERHV